MTKEWAELIGHFVWPVTIFSLVWIFQDPLSNFIRVVARRITKISAFKVNIELGHLSAASTLRMTIEGLGKAARVDEGKILPIVSEFLKSGKANYVTIDIGKNSDQWLTSRLFLLSALLERGRNVRSVVFLQEGRFIAAATPRDIRICSRDVLL